MPKVLNKKNLTWAKNQVYISRGAGGRHMLSQGMAPGENGWLGNPFLLTEFSRQESVARFKSAFHEKLDSNSKFRDAVLALKGKDLVCWCTPLACHGDVILAFLGD